MKTITAAMKAHIQQNVTTLTLCWMIERMDFAGFGFTSLDVPFLFTSGRLSVPTLFYQSAGGFAASALVAHASGQVDNQEVIGYFSPTGIIAEDLENGKFDYAAIYYFAINYADPTMDIIPLKRGFLGECTLSPSGVFTTEIRGLTQSFVQEFGNAYSPICRADLGDSKCKVPVVPFPWQPNLPRNLTDITGPLARTVLSQDIAMWECVQAGTTGPSEPAWSYDGNYVVDGTVVWQGRVPYRQAGTVTARLGAGPNASFRTTPLTFPGASLGNTATIEIVNNISANTALEINDGAGGSFSLSIPFDVDAQTYYAVLATDLQSAPGMAFMTITFPANLVISFTNNSGYQGHISKVGDVLGAIQISEFAGNYLDGGAVHWLTGDNAGVTSELKTYDSNSSECLLWLSTNFAIQIGDQFLYYAGCDKRRETCGAKFNNILNFRGEPDMPGVDRMLQFADAT